MQIFHMYSLYKMVHAENYYSRYELCLKKKYKKVCALVLCQSGIIALFVNQEFCHVLCDEAKSRLCHFLYSSYINRHEGFKQSTNYEDINEKNYRIIF